MALPAHQRLPDHDTDEELSDEQVRTLLDEAERRMRETLAPAPTNDGPVKLPKLDPGRVADLYFDTKDAKARLDSSKLIDEKDRALAQGFKKIEDPIQVKKNKQAGKKATAGSQWFNLPKTELTPELRRDLQLLKMRGILDPKRFYKKSDAKSDVPEFSQIGTVIEGPTEYYTARINNKDRKRTFVEEVLAQEDQTGRFKNKYNEIQKKKSSGKKTFYKELKAKRKGRVEKR
ncbi:Fcf2-domain-containing protein [Polyplosphaeria fusca]|uniref:Fcf2-domain-containing protein n=1 Tax=Polyplosphaeria fusca TaxID=682080 RepID=A0A9P4QTJ1_9PLEO|nr:Fcf2-domain-containing protein [Polyplosphaeria fusca]